MSGKRDRTNELKVFLSDNEQYVLDEKVKTSHMRNKSEYIRHLILYGYVYDIDYNGLKEYNYQIAALGRNINMIRERIMKTGNALIINSKSAPAQGTRKALRSLRGAFLVSRCKTPRFCPSKHRKGESEVQKRP